MDEPRLEWEERTYHKIRLDPANVRQCVVWPHETIIRLEIGDAKYEAMVPTTSLPEDHTYVPAQKVGRIGDKLVLVLPPGNDGTTYWRIPEGDLYKVLVK